MINKKFIQKLKQDHKDWDGQRRQIISLSNIVLHDSKRVIFSLHRGDKEEAGKNLEEIEKIIKNLEKKFGRERIGAEGAFRAATEEYVEAKMLYLVLAGKTIDKIKGINLNFESYLGGICDLTGELVHRAVNEAAGGNLVEVKKVNAIINEIMAQLIEFDMTGYLRTKYDQAKGNLRKIEQINYETRTKRQ